MSDSEAGSRLHPVTRRFADPELERDYQLEAGREMRDQMGLGQLFGGILWLGGGLILPQISPVDTTLVPAVVITLWVVTAIGYWLSRHTPMLDDVQAISIVLNIISLLAVLALVVATPGIQHQAAPAIMLVALYAFVVLRLRFAFAVMLALVHVVAYAVVVVTRLVPTAFALELFLVAAAAAAGVLAAYMLETSGRQVFAQRRIIEAQGRELAREKEKSDDLLRNVLPERVVERLRNEPTYQAEEHPAVTVLFADLVGFTPLVSGLSADRIVGLLDELFTRFDELVDRFGVNKVKTIGDAYMVVAGAPDAVADHAERVVRLGIAMLDVTRAYAKECAIPLRLRVGVNSGPIVAGVIGRNRFSYDLWGDTVNVASRMESHGLEGRVQLSEATWRLVDDQIPTEGRGEIDVKGKGLMRTYLVRHEAESLAEPAAIDAVPARGAAPPGSTPVETAPATV